jgi:hypothetical protein
MNIEQEPKYDVNAEGKLFNRASGEVIPDDEPVMIFRARDKNAALMISYYRRLCSDAHHSDVVGKRLHDFVDFAHAHPERMKEPDTAAPLNALAQQNGEAG